MSSAKSKQALHPQPSVQNTACQTHSQRYFPPDGVFHNTGNTPITTPTLHGTRTEADNRKATPHHFARDASVQGASGAFLSTHFWTNCIDRVSPCAHDSRVRQTQALATCVMADQNGRCCMERALKGRSVRRSRHFVIVQSRAQMDTSYCLCMGLP